MRDYNKELCDSRHENIENDKKTVWGENGFGAVWKRIDSLEGKLWMIILGLVLNFGGVIAILIQNGA